MKIAVCFDECGDTAYIECDDEDNSDVIPDEYRFRYWQQPDTEYMGRISEMYERDTWDLY